MCIHLAPRSILGARGLWPWCYLWLSFDSTVNTHYVLLPVTILSGNLSTPGLESIQFTMYPWLERQYSCVFIQNYVPTMHCSVWDPGILQSGTMTLPSRNPSASHTRGPGECVHRGTLGIAGWKGGREGGREGGGREGGGRERGKEKKGSKKESF